MTIIIRSNNTQLDLPSDVKLNIEVSSPIFSNANSMSLPISIPFTGHNRRALNFPDVINMYDAENAMMRVFQDVEVLVTHGHWQQVATLSISGFSETAAEATLYFNESNLWSKLEGVTLPQAMAGLHYGDIPSSEEDIAAFRQNLFASLAEDYKTYPTFIDPREDERLDRQGNITYSEWQVMLTERAEWFRTRDFVMAPLFTKDGWLNEIYSPRFLKQTNNYQYITAFLRLDFVLHKVFEKAGFSLIIDFDSFPDEREVREYSCLFEEQWQSLVVLNNTMDALYPGCLYYSSLVPEISCKEFLKAIQAQFGCAFFHQPDGSFKMRFTQTILSSSVGDIVTQYHNRQVSFTSVPDYNPASDIEKSSIGNIQYSTLPGTQHDYYYESGHAALDRYPMIHTISLDGVCQRTTTTVTDDEDSTKSSKCPLIFAAADFAIIYNVDNERDWNKTDSYPAIRKPYIELLRDIHPTLYITNDIIPWYFGAFEGDSLYQLLNKAYFTIIEHCDKLTVIRMLTTQEIANYDFTKPSIIKNRLCWPAKLLYEMSDAILQQVTIEFLSPRKIV